MLVLERIGNVHLDFNPTNVKSGICVSIINKRVSKIEQCIFVFDKSKIWWSTWSVSESQHILFIYHVKF